MTKLAYKAKKSMCLYNLLTNPSFAAFLGAFSAFMLVFLTDSIRKRRKRKALNKLIEVSLDVTRNKKDAVQRTINAIKKDDKLIGDRLLYFPLDEIKTLKIEVINQLKEDQILAIDAIVFKMRSIDEIVEETVDVLNKVRLDYSKLDKNKEAFLLNSYEDIKVNLNFLEQMQVWYKQKKFKKIISHKYRK